MRPATTEDVLELMDSHITAAALGAAMELGLFWLLRDRPMDATGVARALGIPVRRCHYWLQLLRKTGLLEQNADGYVPTATARTAILEAYDQESWAFLAGDARQRFPVLSDLVQQIREPGSVWAIHGLRPPDYFAELVRSADWARRFTRMLYQIHRSMAEQLAGLLDLERVSRLMDLGGGSGVMSLAMARRQPGFSAVVVDIPTVCVAGREIVAENGMAERVTHYAADFLRDELPVGFDLILQCDTGAYGVELLRKGWASLHPGGRLVIVDQFAPAEGVAHPSRVHWAFVGSLANPDSTPTTAADVRIRLDQAGFELLSERTLTEREEQRWSRGWLVIEAIKRT